MRRQPSCAPVPPRARRVPCRLAPCVLPQCGRLRPRAPCGRPSRAPLRLSWRPRAPRLSASLHARVPRLCGARSRAPGPQPRPFCVPVRRPSASLRPLIWPCALPRLRLLPSPWLSLRQRGGQSWRSARRYELSVFRCKKRITFTSALPPLSRRSPLVGKGQWYHNMQSLRFYEPSGEILPKKQ